MNRDKQYFGPESPADLKWSQGAKNTWNYGTPAGDTYDYLKSSRALVGETGRTTKNDGQRASQHDVDWTSRREENVYRAPQGGTTNLYGSGPPKGDTNPYYHSSRNIVHSQKNEGWVRERSRLWYVNVIKNHTEVMEEFMRNPSTTAVAVNGGDNLGLFTPEERVQFSNDIMIQVYEYEVPDQPKAFVPKFQSTKYIQGLLIFKCFESKTAHWLTTLTFSKLWKGAKVEIFVERDFAKLILCQLRIPKPVTDTTDIFQMLKLQNNNICTNRWKLMEKADTNSEVCIDIAIDEVSLRLLKSLKMELYYGVGKIQFHVLSQSSLEEEIFSDNLEPDVIINPIEHKNKLSLPVNYPKTATQVSAKNISSQKNFQNTFTASGKIVESTTKYHQEHASSSSQRSYPSNFLASSKSNTKRQDYTGSYDDPSSSIAQKFQESDDAYKSSFSSSYNPYDPFNPTEPDTPFIECERSRTPVDLYESEGNMDSSRQSHTNYYRSDSPKKLDYSESYVDPFQDRSYPGRPSSPRFPIDSAVNLLEYQRDYELSRLQSRSPQRDRLRSPRRDREPNRSPPRFRDRESGKSPPKFKDQESGRSPPRYRDRESGRSSPRFRDREHGRSPPRYRDREQARSPPRYRDREQARSPPRYRGGEQARSPPRSRNSRSRRSPVSRNGNSYRGGSPPRRR